MKPTSPLLFLLYISMLFSFSGFGQNKKPVQDSLKSDPAKLDFVSKMQGMAKVFAKESAADFEADKATIAQNIVFEEIKKTMQKAKTYLRAHADTLKTRAAIMEIEADFAIAGDGALTNQGTGQTFRNLTASAKILNQLLQQAISHKTVLDLHQQQLNTYRYQLDSLLSVPSLFKFPSDSATLIKYIQQIKVANYEIHPVDSLLKRSSTNARTQLNQVNVLVLKLESGLEEIAIFQQEMAKKTFGRDFSNLWEPAAAYRPFGEILSQALAKGWLTLAFYAQNHAGKLVILLLLVCCSFYYLRSLKGIYIEQELLVRDFEGQLVLRYPLCSAIVLVLNTFQFIFVSPPFLLSVIFWLISCISLTIMFHQFITRYWMNVWLLMVALFLAAAFDNLILQASRIERWFMLGISVMGTISGILILLKGKKQELREKLILISIGLMAFLEFCAILANLFGRYNLGKTLLMSGFLNVVVAILFLWTIRLINEGLFLAFSVYTQQDKKLFYLNFDKVGKRVPSLLYVLLILGWLILFGRNFAGFDYLAEPLKEFLSRERTLGSYTFSINSLFLFFVIMGVSVVVSKIVSFFASDAHIPRNKEEKESKRGIGSWLLLVRITILSIGLFLAIAAAGIPVDKIAIVLGALGVGIGFGLQTMVNHLVSGLIIAFEKPVNVGDIVDIDGQAGTMKSIGFRSSVITTNDGADLVMPNGDLLNSHLINWSLGGNRRRMLIQLGIDYEADLEKAKMILMDLLNEDQRIWKKNPPLVQYDQFDSSAITLKIYFWARDFREAGAVRSDLIIAITAAFKTNEIKIPFPQQDIYIHKAEDKLE